VADIRMLGRERELEPESRQVRRTRERAARKASAAVPDHDSFPTTEAGDAEYFSALEDGRLLYDHARRSWYVFEAHHWRPDATGSAVQRAIEAMRRRQAAALRIADSDERARRAKWALAGESDTRIRHLLDLASTHPNLATSGEAWDTDPMVLGAMNGTIDLRTGQLRPGSPADLITRVAPVPFDNLAACSRWAQFVSEVAGGDLELASYLGRMLGYVATGLTGEQVFFLLFGHGSNGKTTLLETISRHVIPQHSWSMPFPTVAWTESISEYQRAELVGRRLVIAKESEQSKRLNTEFIKSLTGTDTVNARHPYGRPFTFAPVAKVVLACNHKPKIRDESHGMWRRVRLLPFACTFAVNPSLGDELAAEAPGILRWLVEQCLDWQQHTLGLPTAIQAATAEYQRESDSLAAFLDDRCVIVEHAKVQASPAFTAYRAWCGEQQIAELDRLNLRTFGEAMKARFRAGPSSPVIYHGVGLREGGLA